MFPKHNEIKVIFKAKISQFYDKCLTLNDVGKRKNSNSTVMYRNEKKTERGIS